MSQVRMKLAMAIPLLAPLLLAACGGISAADYNAVQAQNQQMRAQIADQQAHIDRLRSAIQYTVESDLLFPSGGYQVSAGGKDLIAKFAQKLGPAASPDERIVVTGYTDNARIGPALARQGITSNQILSEKRADSVMQYMIAQGAKPEQLSAVGKGEADPVASNDTAAGRAANRRVELTLIAANAAPPPNNASVGTVEFSGGNIAAGIGYSWGSGTLTYRGQVHHFKISGFSAAAVGASTVDASGEVSNLSNLTDFSGTYTQGGIGAAAVVGGSVVTMQNEHGVTMNVRSTKVGLHFQLGAGGATVQLLD